MEDDQYGRRPKWKTNKMVENKNGRQEHYPPALLWTVNTSKLILVSKCDFGPKLKTTKMEDDQNGRRPKWKTTKI